VRHGIASTAPDRKEVTEAKLIDSSGGGEAAVPTIDGSIQEEAA